MLCVKTTILTHTADHGADSRWGISAVSDSGIPCGGSSRPEFSFQSLICGRLPTWEASGGDLPSLGLSFCICKMERLFHHWWWLVLRSGDGAKLCPGRVKAQMGAPEGGRFVVKYQQLRDPQTLWAACRNPGSLPGAGDRPRRCCEGCPGAAAGAEQECPLCPGRNREDLSPAGRPGCSAGVLGRGGSAGGHRPQISGTTYWVHLVTLWLGCASLERFRFIICRMGVTQCPFC